MLSTQAHRRGAASFEDADADESSKRPRAATVEGRGQLEQHESASRMGAAHASAAHLLTEQRSTPAPAHMHRVHRSRLHTSMSAPGVSGRRSSHVVVLLTRSAAEVNRFACGRADAEDEAVSRIRSTEKKHSDT